MKGFKIKLNSNAKLVDKAIEDSVVLATESAKSDLVSSKTMPYDTGTLQNESTRTVPTKNKSAKIVCSTSYAERLYYHPEFRFNKANNSNAGGMWFEPYLSGKKKNYIKNSFSKILGERISKI